MDGELLNLLQSTKSTDNLDNQGGTGLFGRGQTNNTYTHLTYWGPHQRWTIRSGKMAIFWQRYCELVHERPEGQYSLAERPFETMPVIVEGTLKFQIEDPSSPIHEAYGPDFILAVVACYQQAIEEIMALSEQRIELICCVIESDQMWEDNGTAGGETVMAHQFRLQFPYCKTDVGIQNQTIRARAIQLLRHNNVVSRLPQQPINDWETILNPMVVQEPVVMYGSKCQANRPNMSLTYILNLVGEDHINSGLAPELPLETVFHRQNHTHIQQGIVEFASLSADRPLDFWLPMFLSIYYWMVITLPRNDHTKPIKMNSPGGLSGSRSTPPGLYAQEEETDLELAERFIQMLGRERLENQPSWLDVGRALYNASSGGEDGLNTWIRWTEQSDDHDSEECRNLYPGFRGSYVTVKTLAWFARKDSPDQYLAWHKSWCQPAMERATSCLHTDVARALYRVYWLEFVCSSLDKGAWYFFADHRWNRLDNGLVLRQAISGDFLKRFELVRTEISRQIQESEDRHVKDTGEVLIKKIGNLIGKLKTVSFKTNIMKEAMEFFHNDNFDRAIDSNENLLGLTNGVVEVCDDQAYVREGRPEDFVSKCTGIPYRHDLTWESNLVQRLQDWMGKVFPDPALKHHFYKMSASGLKGRNARKLFPIWTGEGDNSKSMVVKLFECAYGTYCIKFPTSLLTGKRTQSSAPMPEVARSKATRWAFLQEPDDEEELKGGLLKEMTGGDSFFARMLHDNGGEVEAFFKLVLMCNKPPAVPTGGKAVKNRLRIFPFLSTWVHNPPATAEEQMEQRRFKMDPFFEKQIPELAQAFLWLMVQYYPIYIAEGLEDPPIVEEATRRYWEENDVYTQFTNECIRPATKKGGEGVEIRDETAKMTLTEVYREFKGWYRSAYPNQKVPTRPIVRGELVQRWGQLFNESWYGIRPAEHLAQI